jgi:hypothetical protein
MLWQLKRIISLFALVVFLFPIITEDVHSFSHKDDFHCTAQNEKHFHQAAHHCPICDYVPVSADKQANCNEIVAQSKFSTLWLSIYNSIVIEKSNYFFSLRGPPAVS